MRTPIPPGSNKTPSTTYEIDADPDIIPRGVAKRVCNGWQSRRDGSQVKGGQECRNHHGTKGQPECAAFGGRLVCCWESGGAGSGLKRGVESLAEEAVVRL